MSTAVMRIAYPAVFLAMIVEGGAVRRRRRSHSSIRSSPDVRRGLGAGDRGVLALFCGDKALKWWAIVSLGPAWTFRVIVVPGDAPVAGGPYTWLRHPNYVGVVGELVGVALMSGARVSGPIGTLAFCALMLRRIAVENRALHRV